MTEPCPDSDSEATRQAAIDPMLPTDDTATVASNDAPSFASGITDDQSTVTGDRTSTVAAGQLNDLPEFPPGHQIGRYVIESQLGAGAMGVVYSAYDPELGRKLAIKLLRGPIDEVGSGPSSASSEQTRFLREAQALARLDHANVLRVYDVGTVEGRTFIATEFVDGQTLSEWSRSAKRSWRDAFECYVQAARGLAAAHAEGIVHRDFKPHNVLIGEDGRVRVMDFGLARSLDTHPSIASARNDSSTFHDSRSDALLEFELTQVGTVMGTPAYMAPEQHRGDVVDDKADQYSYCLAFYEALYGHNPFRIAGKSFFEAKLTVPLSAASRSKDHPQAIPRWLRRALVRGLSVDPAERWASMADLLQEFERRRRRRSQKLAAAGIAVLAALGASSGYAQHLAQQRSLCSGGAERLHGVWDAEQRRVLQAAFEASPVPIAATTWTRIRDALDSYTQMWRTEYHEVCAATQLRGEQSAERMDVRMACLDDLLLDVRSLTRLWHTPSEASIEKAVEAVAALEPIDVCDDADALLAGQRLPADPQVRATIETLQRDLADARALQHTGQYTLALERTEDVLGRLEGIDYPPLQLEAKLRRALILADTGQLDAAASLLAETSWQAEALALDRLVAQARVRLVRLVGYDLARGDEGLLWGRHARASLTRTTDVLRLESDLLSGFAVVHGARGDIEQALDYAQRSLAQRIEVFGPASSQVVSGYSVMAWVLATLGRDTEALEHCQHAVSAATQALGSQHPQLSLLYYNLGTRLLMMGRYDEAEAEFQRALAIAEQGLDRKHGALARAHEGLGLVAMARGDLERASVSLEQVAGLWAEQLGTDHPDYARALSDLAFVRTEQGKSAEAVELFQRSITVLEAAELGPEAFVDPLNGLGTAATTTGDLVTARGAFERVLTILGDSTISPPSRALANFGLAKIEWAEHNEANARTLAQRAEAELATLDTPADRDALAEVRRWLAGHP